MEWTEEKQRFDPLNQLRMPSHRKEEIRARLHAEIAQMDRDPQARRSKRRIAAVTSISAAAAVAAASLIVIVQSTNGNKFGPATGHTATSQGSVAMGPTQGTKKGLEGKSAAGSSTQSSSSSASSTATNQQGGLMQMAQQPARSLTADNPIAMFGNSGWLLTTSGLFHTVDGGKQWTPVTIGASTSSQSVPSQSGQGNSTNQAVAVLNGEEARVARGTIVNGKGQTSVGHTTVFRTEDGGTTWEFASVANTSSADPAGQIPASLTFAGAKDGWMTMSKLQPGMGGTAPGGVYRTTDGGQTWSRLSTSFGNGVVAFQWLAFTNSRIGFTEAAPQANADAGVTTGQYRMYRTSDGGSHWQAVSQPVTNAQRVDWQPPQWAGSDGYTLASIQTAGGSQQLALYHSADDGQSWTVTYKFPSGNGSGNGLAMSVTQQAIWVFWDGGLWKSTDGGQQFDRVKENIGSISSLDMVDAQHGIAVVVKPLSGTAGEAHVFYRTTDGGKTWIKLTEQPG